MSIGRGLVAIALAVSALAAASGAAGASAPGVMTGRVWLDPKTSECVAARCPEPALGVEIVFSRPGARRVVKTNGEGRYRITLAPGLYRVTGPGLLRRSDALRIGSGQRRVLDLFVDGRYAHPDGRSASST